MTQGDMGAKVGNASLVRAKNIFAKREIAMGIANPRPSPAKLASADAISGVVGRAASQIEG